MEKKYVNWIDANSELLIDASDQIWDFAELALEEYKSSELLVKILDENGFSVEKGVADMPTAFTASYGSGKKPVIGILGEYDALPGLNQAAKPFRESLKENAPGHGCGHNLLGVGSLGAVLAVKNAIDAGDAKGTIRYYGCPAEEQFNAKGYMVNKGLLNDVDISLTWHPFFLNMVNLMSALALNSVVFQFHGRTAHAAGDPQNGRSALDAVELMNIGVNYLREHVIPDARLHYVITNGGKVPNIVPDFAEVWYYVRAPKRPFVEEIYKRVVKIAKGAALMTETELKIDFLTGCYNHMINDTVCKVIHNNMLDARPPKFNKKDKDFAKELQKSIPENSMDGYYRFVPPDFMDLAKAVLEQPLNKIILPEIGKGAIWSGSTDVADVSWVIPLGEFQMACQVIGSPGHSWQNVSTSGMSIGHKGMLAAAKTLTLSALQFMNSPQLVEKAQKEFNIKIKNNGSYKSPLPDGLKPPFHRTKLLSKS
ncbi:MAG: M20 family metallopeptidase [Candidatus Hermodarchaeota archaeon]